jgi:hypothetical protein
MASKFRTDEPGGSTGGTRSRGDIAAALNSLVQSDYAAAVAGKATTGGTPQAGRLTTVTQLVRPALANPALRQQTHSRIRRIIFW